MPIDWTEIADRELIGALTAVAGMATSPRTSPTATIANDLAGSADGEALRSSGLPGRPLAMPDMNDLAAVALEVALSRHETRGALQALLAVRLADAPESDAAKARKAVRLALRGSETTAERLTQYFDDRISALVASRAGRDGPVGRSSHAGNPVEVTGGRGIYVGTGGTQVNVFGTDSRRIEALLGAIDRQLTALAAPGHGGPEEADWVTRYRRQAHQRHGFLSPPDFDRRRRVPVEAIYVPTEITEEDHPERTRPPAGTAPDALTVRDLAGWLDRTVLLGDPGGGKTTAANVLADQFARDPASRIPFLVTLREYAAQTPPRWSVTEYIEQNARTLYQCPAPDGLVERLLLTGQAVVLFDGLDELLDTSRRRDVSERVEQFSSAYPLTPVLVTSRLVGYDQARLDDDQFRCFRLGGLGDAEVAEYAGKWFAAQEGFTAAEAAAKATAFLAESAGVPDLRSNPLLLALMCILYRGAGSLPGDRAGIYARCAELLFRRWDEHRDLYRQVRADHLVEPTIRHLAWWLFTREDSRAEATERELTARTAEFLYQREYESWDEARAAAQEFVAFCRGRLWVFSDAGTTADGEKLYGFTHRTFLEYFAAGHLAATSDNPEDLARNLMENKTWQPGWRVVAELAIKIKGGNSDRAADRVYAVLLAAELPLAAREDLLLLLVNCVTAVRPSPATMRILLRATVDSPYSLRSDKFYIPLSMLLANIDYRTVIADELTHKISMLATADDPQTRAKSMEIVLETAIDRKEAFWQHWSAEQIGSNFTALSALAGKFFVSIQALS